MGKKSQMSVLCVLVYIQVAPLRVAKTRHVKQEKKSGKNSEKMMGGDVDAEPLFRHLRLFHHTLFTIHFNSCLFSFFLVAFALNLVLLASATLRIYVATLYSYLYSLPEHWHYLIFASLLFSFPAY